MPSLLRYKWCRAFHLTSSEVLKAKCSPGNSWRVTVPKMNVGEKRTRLQLFHNFFDQAVCSLGDALELWFALEVQEDGCFLDLAVLQHTFDDFVTVKRL